MSKARDLADSADKDIAGTIVLDDITLSNDMSVADNGKVIFGNDADLEILYDTTNSIIKTTNTHSFKLMNGSSDYITATPSNAVTLYHNGSPKLATASGGANVTGTLTAGSGITVTNGTSDFSRTHSTTTASLQILDLKATSAGNMADGFGPSIHFSASDTGTTSNQVAEINAVRAGSDTTFNLELQTADATRMTIGNGFVDITGTLNLSNNNTNNTNKEGHLLARQYASGTETEGFQVLQYFANSSLNRIDIGGAASPYNAATAINFYTAANTTTRTGTLALSIDSSQNSTFSGSVTADGFQTDTSNTNFNLLARNSSNTAVYIQNGGSGNILEAQSGSMSAGQGITRFRVANDGDVFLGTSDYGDKLNVTGTGHFTGNVTLSRQTNDSGSTGLTFEKTRSTSVNGNTLVQSGDQLGYVAFRGNDGDQFLDGAYILAFVDSSPANNDMPTNLQFWTTGDGNSSPTERMRIAQDGRVGIGLGGANPSYMLHVDGGSNPAARFQQNNSTVQIGEFPANGGAVIWMDGSNGDLSGSDYFGIHALNTTDLSFSADGGEIRMTMKNDGKLGIGTSNPSEKLEVAGTALVENAKLKAIAKSNSDTAIDVFVYDTRKDSDGGAWRKRTQNTSWYNETLNTSTRGSRKEFPCVAVIVVESSELTIYDGDDPDMPMWMTFPINNSSWLKHSGGGCKAVVARDGIMVTGGDIRGSIVRFIADDGNVFEAAHNYEHHGLTTRNTSVGPSVGPIRIVHNKVNDVAITVLPNAPIDPDTGLPVPTIAVATDGGVTVIKDDGNCVDITYTTIYKLIMYIDFTKENHIIFGNDGYSSLQRWAKVYEIPLVDQTGSNGTDRSGALFHYVPYTTGSSYGSNPDHMWPEGVRFLDVISNAIATDDIGAVRISDDGKSLAYITSDYNTGYMNVDTKLATLASTDSANISSSGNTNLLSGGWTNNGSFPYETFTQSGLDITSAINTTAYGALNKTWTAVPGRTYTAKFNLTLNSGVAPRLFVQTTSSFGNGLEYQTVNGVNCFTFKASMSSSSYFTFATNNGDATNFSVANLELYEGGVVNRSSNPIGVSVFGGITKTAVATGAELMGYSFGSNSNYLEQSYDSSLDFGTGDFSVVCWVKPDSSMSAYPSIVNRYVSNNQESTAWLLKIAEGTSSYYFFSNQTQILSATGTVNFGVWQQVAAVRRNGILYLYVDGKLEATGAMTHTVTQSGAKLSLSRDATHHLGNSNLALLRVSATAPSPEQIAYMYNQEKHLFQPNAKASLYGTSNVVTAIAYDDDEELLHVGTSAGRSVFQGLTRIDNTTDAIASAISASNGLVAED